MVWRRLLAYLLEGLCWTGVAYGATLPLPEESPQESMLTEPWLARQTRPHR
jgi:hypothetical protein